MPGLFGLLFVLMGPGQPPAAVTPQPVAWFTDNVDRQPLQVLRDKPPETLTEKERAILTAANRVGWIENRDCGRGLNGILITFGGRDGVLTSRHLLGGKIIGDLPCAPGSETLFYPNYGYQTPTDPSALGDDDLYASVPLTGEAMNLNATGLVMSPNEDWMIFWLDTPLSDQPMPPGAFGAGQPRGAVPIATEHPPRGQATVIGFDSRFADENGWQFSWQTCRFARGPWPNADTLYTDCDVSPGASGSLMGTLMDGELVLQGLVTGAMDALSGTDVPTPRSLILWNLGTSTEPVQRALDALP